MARAIITTQMETASDVAKCATAAWMEQVSALSALITRFSAIRPVVNNALPAHISRMVAALRKLLTAVLMHTAFGATRKALVFALRDIVRMNLATAWRSLANQTNTSLETRANPVVRTVWTARISPETASSAQTLLN